MFLPRFTAVVLFLASLHAFAQTTCTASGGAAAAIEDVATGSPFEVVAMTDSAAVSRPFRVKDALGRALSNIDIDVTLPEAPSSLMFWAPDGTGSIAPTATPKHATVRIGQDCMGYLPSIVVGPDAGIVMADASVKGFSSGVLAIPVRALTGQAMVRFDVPPPTPIVVATNAHVIGGYIPAASAEWSDGVYSGPIAGVPITFTTASSGPRVRFSNGASSITVVTGPFGGASAPVETIGPPGFIEVIATYPDGSVVRRTGYIALDAPVIGVANDATFEYGTDLKVTGVARYGGYPCSLMSQVDQLRSSVRVTASGQRLSDATLLIAQAVCTADGLEIPISASLAGVPFGMHSVVVEVYGHLLLPPSQSPPTQIRVIPAVSLQTPTGRGSIRIGASDPGYPLNGGRCGVSSARAIAPSSGDLPSARPDAVDLPYGALRLELSGCAWRNLSDFGEVPASRVSQRVLLEVDEELAPGTVAWAFGPTPEESLPHWYELRTTIVGRFAQFEVTDGGRGDGAATADGAITPLIALGVPSYAAVAGSFQDLWWAGPGENGWGMNVTQHRDILFVTLFVYDARGDPRWLVMPGGEWNAARTTYTGNVYSPKGTPFAMNIASGFQVGAPVGTLRVTPSSYDTMTLEYTLYGVNGTKQVQRQRFGPANPFPAARFDDLWWGGIVQSGWGFALAQQYRTFFGVLYTYDANGDPIWFVAPSGALTQNSARLDNIMESKVYRTRGSPWIGIDYDPTKLVVTEVGSLRLILTDGWDCGQLTGAIDGWRTFGDAVCRQPF